MSQTPFHSTSCYITTQQGESIVRCMRTAELSRAGHFQATFGVVRQTLRDQICKATRIQAGHCMHGNGRPSLASLWPAWSLHGCANRWDFTGYHQARAASFSRATASAGIASGTIPLCPLSSSSYQSSTTPSVGGAYASSHIRVRPSGRPLIGNNKRRTHIDV